MRRTSSAVVVSLLLSAPTFAQAQQQQQQQQQSNGSIGGAILGATGLTNGTKVTIQMLDSVTTLNTGATYSAQVSQAIVGSSTNIPGGTPAVVKVVQNTGYPATYSLALVSLSINGTPTPVSGSMPVLNKIGTAVNGASDALGSAVGNLFNKQKNQPKAPRPPAASVAGVRIYVPVNSAVMFTLTSAPMQSAQGQPAAGGATSVAQPVQQTPAATGMNTAPGSNTVTYLQVQYVLQGCTRQAPHIICNLTITNQRGGDIVMNGGGGAYYIDQAGNRVNAMMRSLANCVGFGPCQLVPGVAMASQWQFVDQDNLAKTLVRLEIHENGVAVAQFNNIPVN
ncbi:MAG TPA: hypothetical protein VFA43_10365 [Gemmatimonadaceae bacterium]|nr:hypothetical protein [Gemmatimonadaceae bacterium]